MRYGRLVGYGPITMVLVAVSLTLTFGGGKSIAAGSEPCAALTSYGIDHISARGVSCLIAQKVAKSSATKCDTLHPCKRRVSSQLWKCTFRRPSNTFFNVACRSGKKRVSYVILGGRD